MTATTDPVLDHEAPGLVVSMVRYWRSSVLIVVVAAAAAYGVSTLLPERYVASSRIALLDPFRDDAFPRAGALPPDLENYTTRQAGLLVSANTLDRVEEDIPGQSYDTLRDDVTVTTETPGELDLTVAAATAARARELTEAVARAYARQATAVRQFNADDRIGGLERERIEAEAAVQSLSEAAQRSPGDAVVRAELQGAAASLGNLEQEVREIRANANAFGDGIEFVASRGTPRSPVEPVPIRNAAVAALFALLVAGAMAWFRADRHRAADESSTAGRLLGAPLLGVVPELRRDEEVAALTDATSLGAESYSFVASGLQQVLRWGVLLVTSADREDGKTLSSAGVAAAATRDGKRVLLIDGDVRAASLTARLLGDAGREGPGLAELLSGKVGLQEAVRLLALSEGQALAFISAGAPEGNPASLLRGPGVGRALQEARDAYDLVIVDCPTLLAVADVPSLSPHADGLLMIVRRGAPVGQLEEVRRRLELLPAALVGFVFTRSAVGGAQPYGPRPSPKRTWRRRWPTLASYPTTGPASGPGSDTNGSGAGHPAPEQQPVEQRVEQP